MKRRIQFPLYGSICIALLLLSCGSREHEKRELQQELWESKVNEVQTNLINHYNPIVFPPKDFSERKIITYNIEKLLINKDGRPVLFEGLFDDITRDGDQFFIHFLSLVSLDYFDDRRIQWNLKCEYAQVKSIIDNPPAFDPLMDALSDFTFMTERKGDLSVVCRVIDVKKIVNYTIEEYSEVQTSDVFRVTGELMEMVKYPPLPS